MQCPSSQCCPFTQDPSQPIGNISKEALVYNLLKQLDPYHLTFGAIQCNDAWMWNDVLSYVLPKIMISIILFFKKLNI